MHSAASGFGSRDLQATVGPAEDSVGRETRRIAPEGTTRFGAARPVLAEGLLLVLFCLGATECQDRIEAWSPHDGVRSKTARGQLMQNLQDCGYLRQGRCAVEEKGSSNQSELWPGDVRSQESSKDCSSELRELQEGGLWGMSRRDVLGPSRNPVRTKRVN